MSRIVLVLLVLSGLGPFVVAAPPVAAPEQETRADENTTERLAAKLREAIPGSRIDVIPNTRTSVILTGYVPKTKDIDTAIALAEEAGSSAVNFLRREGTPRVELDVVFIEVDRSTNARDDSTAKWAPELCKGVLDEKQRDRFLALLRSKRGARHARIVNRSQLSAESAGTASYLPRGEAAVPVPVIEGGSGPFVENVERLTCVPTVLHGGSIRLQSEVDVVAFPPPKDGVGRWLQLRTTELKRGQSLVLTGRGWVVLITPKVAEPVSASLRPRVLFATE